MERPIVITNPHSGAAQAEKAVALILERLPRDRRFGLAHRPEQIEGQAEVLRTEYAGHATEIARRIRPSCPIIIVAGGDGTISEVENGLMAGACRGHASPPIGIIPIGTANTLAYELGIPKDVPSALDVILNGKLRRIDLGMARLHHAESGAEITKYFHCMAGAGFDAEVVRIYQAVRGRKSRPHHYVLPVLLTLKDFALPRIRVAMDGEELTAAAASVVVGNSRAYAVHMAVAARARPDDGLLDACILLGRTRMDMVLTVLNVLLRRHLKRASTVYRVGREISLRSDSPVAVQLDGDLAGCLPMEIVVKPLAVSYFVPQHRTAAFAP